PYHPGTSDGGAPDGGGDDGDAGAAAPDAPPPDARPPDLSPTDRPSLVEAAADRPPEARPDAPAPHAGPVGDLIGCWTFAQRGPVYADQSGNGNNAVVNSVAIPPTWLATLAGRAGVIRFDQTQSWLEVAASSSLNLITSAFTVAARIYLPS